MQEGPRESRPRKGRGREGGKERKEGRRPHVHRRDEGGREGGRLGGSQARTAPLQSPHFSATTSPVPSHWSHTTCVCMIPKAVRCTWEDKEGGREGMREGGREGGISGAREQM